MTDASPRAVLHRDVIAVVNQVDRAISGRNRRPEASQCKEITMRRFMVFLTIVAFAFGGRMIGQGSPDAFAREQTSVDLMDSPFTGAWWWENISDDPFDDSYAVIHADGTYVEETSYIGAGIGSWQPTGERTADLLIVFQDIDGGLDPDLPAAFAPGTITFWLSLEVDAADEHLTATGPIEIRSVDGALVDQFTFNGTATRLGIDWERPTATPEP